MKRTYALKSTAAVDGFIADLKQEAVGEKGIFDSVAATALVTEGLSSHDGLRVPESLQAMLDKTDKQNHADVIGAILDGIHDYEADHGCDVPADIVEQAIHRGLMILDDATIAAASESSAYGAGLVPSLPITAILSTMNDAIPFASYLPVGASGLSSNEARLAIISHKANTDFGGYSKGDNIDGENAGKRFMNAVRLHTVTSTGSSPVTGKLTKKQTNIDTCDQAGAVVPVVRGAGKVFVNGYLAATENASNTGSDGILSGSVTLDGTIYVISGTVTLATGAFSISSTPALPSGVKVAVESCVNYNENESLIPDIGIDVAMYSMLASRSSGKVTLGWESGEQIRRQLAVDPMSEMMIALNGQVAVERHYVALGRMLRMASNFSTDHDFEWDVRSQQMNISQVWADTGVTFAEAASSMVSRTIGTTASFGYVGKKLRSLLLSLPRDVFQPATAVRAGIHRIGRLVQHGIDVYYVPGLLAETPTSGQMLLIGRNAEVARSPIILGDYAGPVMTSLPVTVGNTTSASYNTMDFTALNPHGMSSTAAALINFINLK
jgi:hypothetical protein